MRCISPLSIRVDGVRQTVPCGKCNFCLMQRQHDWSFRLRQELKTAETAVFLTLTYDDSQIKINPESGLSTLDKRDLQLFIKRLRKESSLISSSRLRYYNVGEYGTKTSRPHYHSIMFNLPHILVQQVPDIWGHGHCQVGDVNPASIHYVTKYIINRYDDYEGREKPFAMMSKRPGLGSNYVNTHAKWHKDDLRNFTQVNGVKSRLPRYFKEKIFTKPQREQLATEALQLLDEAYWKEVYRLSKFHPDPTLYYDIRIQELHEKIKTNFLKSNKL